MREGHPPGIAQRTELQVFYPASRWFESTYRGTAQSFVLCLSLEDDHQIERGSLMSSVGPGVGSIARQSAKPASAFVCPWCARDSFHVVDAFMVRASVGGQIGFTTWDDSAGAFTLHGTNLISHPSVATSRGYQLDWFHSRCAACSRGAVWRGDELVYPQSSSTVQPHPEMPEAAKELYLEAAAVLPHSKRAAAALARAALERLLRGLPNAQPKDRLADLVAALSTSVSPTLWQLLTLLRFIGNDSLHGDGSSELVTLYLDGDAAEIVEPVFGAINSIVEEVIVQPAEAARLYAMIPEGVRMSAERERDRAQE